MRFQSRRFLQNNLGRADKDTQIVDLLILVDIEFKPKKFHSINVLELIWARSIHMFNESLRFWLFQKLLLFMNID